MAAVFLLAAFLPGFASAGPPKIVTGLVTDPGYGYANYLYQWKIGAQSSDCSMLGGVNLPAVAPFNGYTSFAGNDIAVLSDRRIALVYQRTAGSTVYEVAVMTPQYDGSGNLTNVNVDATISMTRQDYRIAPLPDHGFVVTDGDSPANIDVYTLVASNSWSASAGSGGAVWPPDIVGLVTRDGKTFVTGEYDRRAHKRNTSGMSVMYQSASGDKTWSYTMGGEGLRHPLLTNGWVNTGDQGEGTPSYVCDGAQASGGPYTGPVGKLLNIDGTDIYSLPWACLRDGRVVGLWLGAGDVNSRIRFRVFTLIRDPPSQTAGSIGATGDDFTVTIPGTNPRGLMIAGDYMVPPPHKGTVVWLK
jgi:hypothetical protein